MKYSVIIPTFNRKRILRKCLDSVFSSDFKDFEVIVVDDGSTDGTHSMVKKFGCKYIFQKNGGAARARNNGARQAKGKYLVFIDSDIVIKRNTLGNLDKNLSKHPHMKAVCGYKDPVNLTRGASSDFVMYRKTFNYVKHLKTRKAYGVNSFPETAFFCIRKETFMEHYGFNPNFRKGSEDHEFGRRLRHRIYFFKNLEVLHHYETIGSYVKKLFWRSSNYAKIAHKHGRLEYKCFGTKKEGLNSMLSFAGVLTIPLAFLNSLLLLIPAVILSWFLIRRSGFYRYVYSRAGFLVLISPFLDLFLYIEAGLGAAYGLAGIFARNFMKPIRFAIHVTRVFMSRTPPNIGFFATARCNLAKCSHCFYWKEIDNAKNRKELTLHEIKKISKNMDYLYFLTITGGEPSLRDDLPKVCETFYRNNGLKVISYHTNGFKPKRIADQVEDILVRCPGVILNVPVSIDGPRDVHNKIRKNKKSYDNAIETLKRLAPLREVYPNLDIQYSSTFSTYSKDIFLEMEKEMKPFRIWHSWTHVRGIVRDGESKPPSSAMYEAFRADYKKRKKGNPFLFRNDILNFIRMCVGKLQMDINIRVMKEKRQVVPCNSGIKTVVIRDNGDVDACEMLDMRMGNIRDYNYNLVKLLKSRQAKKVVKHIKARKCYCTHEGNLYTSILFCYRLYPAILKNFLRMAYLKYIKYS